MNRAGVTLVMRAATGFVFAGVALALRGPSAYVDSIEGSACHRQWTVVTYGRLRKLSVSWTSRQHEETGLHPGSHIGMLDFRRG
jgi:hypothetical protein